jgi:hypothetical protein
MSKHTALFTAACRELTAAAKFFAVKEATVLMKVGAAVNAAVIEAHGDGGTPWFLSKDARTLTGTASELFAHFKGELDSRNYSNVSVAWGRVKFYAAESALAENRWQAFRAKVAEKAKEGEEVKAKGVAAQKAKRAKKAAAASAGRTVASAESEESAAVEREVSEVEVQALALRKFSQQDAALLAFADKFAVAVGGIKGTADMPADVLRAVDAMVALFDKALAPKVAPLAKRMPAALNKARQELTAAPEAK